MIIDAHIHLLPRKVHRDRTSFCRTDPAFDALYSSPKARVATEEEIIQYMDVSGIDRAVVFGFPWTDPDLVRENNDEIISFSHRRPGRIIPFAVLSPMGGMVAITEAERTLQGGFAGLGELAVYRGGWNRETLESLDPILHLAAQHGRPVTIHVNEPVGHDYPGKIETDFKALLHLIERNPLATIILAHFGGGLFIYALMPEIAAVLSRTYLDTAAAPFLYDPGIYDIACRVMGLDKILFGSDFPLLSYSPYVREMEKAGLSDTVLDKILGGNALKLLNKTT